MCFSFLKKRKAGTVPLEDVEPMLAAKEDAEPGRSGELRDLVGGALESLPPRQRAAFSMRFYDKLSFKDIAEAMGTSVGAAKASHHFAVEKLRELLSGADGP